MLSCWSSASALVGCPLSTQEFSHYAALTHLPLHTAQWTHSTLTHLLFCSAQKTPNLNTLTLLHFVAAPCSFGHLDSLSSVGDDNYWWYCTSFAIFLVSKTWISGLLSEKLSTDPIFSLLCDLVWQMLERLKWELDAVDSSSRWSHLSKGDSQTKTLRSAGPCSWFKQHSQSKS